MLRDEVGKVNPLVYQPSWSKRDLWTAAFDYINEAAEIWQLPRPVITPTGPPHGRKIYGGGTYYGLWMPPNRIWVNVAAATTPPKVRGRIWSFPGHKTDRTCAGILAHEFGHHIAGCMAMDEAAWREIAAATAPVTSYEPVPSEAWAETMRIFILNPDLLRLGRPRRYEYIRRYFEPLHMTPWREVLANAPDFICDSAAKFASEASPAAGQTGALFQ